MLVELALAMCCWYTPMQAPAYLDMLGQDDFTLPTEPEKSVDSDLDDALVLGIPE